MSQEPELDILRAAWTSSVEDCEAGAAFESRRGRIRAFRTRRVLELAFAAVLIAFAVRVVRAHPDLEMLLWAAVICATALGAAAFQLWNWRGSWKSSGQSIVDYADLYERRCRSMLRAVRFGYRFLALQLAIAAPWLTFDFLRGQLPALRYAMSLGFLALLTAAFVLSFRRSRARALHELSGVQAFRRSLVG